MNTCITRLSILLTGTLLVAASAVANAQLAEEPDPAAPATSYEDPVSSTPETPPSPEVAPQPTPQQEASTPLPPAVSAEDPSPEVAPQQEASIPLPPAVSAEDPPSQQTLLSSNTLVGVPVKDAQGEQLGDIRELMVDPRTGQVVYAVVDSQGTWGFGKQKSFAVPWEALRVGLDQTNVVVELDRNQFPMLPHMALSQHQE